MIVTGYGECGKRERERRGERGVRVSWMKAGMRVSVYEGWRSELWGTRWCPGWQPRWHYLRVCLGRKTEENRSEKERRGRGERKRGEQKETLTEREKVQGRRTVRLEGETLCKKTLEDKGV